MWKFLLHSKTQSYFLDKTKDKTKDEFSDLWVLRSVFELEEDPAVKTLTRII